MINRKAVVERHFPIVTNSERLSPLSVGNGDFAFSADLTGLQTFPASYDVPLGTQSNWGWHSTEEPDYYSFADLSLQTVDTYGRGVDYPLYPAGRENAYHWLRQNPHRLHLGRLSFILLKKNGEQAAMTDLSATKQVLNLWKGCLFSEFQLEGIPVRVTTVVHPKNDELGVKVESQLLKERRLRVALRFPAPDMYADKWEETVALDWGNSERHGTAIVTRTEKDALFLRTMDKDQYQVRWSWSSGALTKTAQHVYELAPAQAKEEFTFSAAFAVEAPETTPFDDMISCAAEYWEAFWLTGGAIDFSGSVDPRAQELERRVMLSQFLTAVHCGGSLPPQETGLMYNSWFGKFHLEMHWWHGAHFPLWGRSHLLEKSLHWYNSILPLAKELAASQGYHGARWPKMTGFDGKQSPSPIAPVLIWQQPHPIALAELCYQANPSLETLRTWQEIVFESAEFMADYAVWDEEKEVFVLGPPLIPAQENHRPEISKNPPFELEYWKYGLEIAIRWGGRLKADVPVKWREVRQRLAEPPHADGVYLAHEKCPDTFTNYNHDHPSMVGALGMLPGALIDPEIMKRTLWKVKEEWQWETAWGWDFPLCAMTAARLGEQKLAVEFLLLETTKNTYLSNGHNYQRPELAAYLPGNGGLLAAVAMMACGWQGASHHKAPGFPDDGSWSVQWEGLHPYL